MKNSSNPQVSSHIYIKEAGVKNNNKIFFVLDPDRPSWVFLNEDGVEILKLCNGTNSVEKISQIISEHHKDSQYSDIFKKVFYFLEDMKQKQILSEKPYGDIRYNKFHGLALEITKECNLHCIHCYLNAGQRSEDELSFDEIKDLIQEMKELEGISIAVGGGEPLTRADCMDIIRYSVSNEVLVSLGTNATLIDKKVAEQLAELPIKIQISIDGATQDIHDHIRGKGSFERAVRGVDNLIHEGKAKDIVIAFTPMKPNLHDVPYIINFARERQIPVVQFPPLTSSGRARQRWNSLKLSAEETLWFWNIIAEKSRELRGEMDLLADCFSLNLNNVGVPYRCSIGAQLRIDPEGYVYPCQCFHYGTEFCLGNVRENKLESLVNGQKLKDIQKMCFQRPSMIINCKKCTWKNFCGAGCMGNIFESKGAILYPESCKVRKQWIDKLYQAKVKEIFS